MTKILLASDLHLCFHNKNTYIEPGPSVGNDVLRDVLVLAGDIHLGTKADEFILEQLEFSDVIYIVGNHEGYHNVQPDMMWAWKGPTTKRINRQAEEKELKGRLHFLENNEVILDGTRFLGCTLWSDFNKGNADVMNAAARDMNDYHLTTMRKGDMYSFSDIKMQPGDTLKWHKQSVKFLKKKLAEEFDGPTVVITHHAPSEKSVDKIYRGEILNGAFFTDLEYLMEEFKYELHCHGHMHTSLDYMVDETRVVCNPRGYFPNQLNPDYEEDMIIEV